jgi:hypothetical protein
MTTLQSTQAPGGRLPRRREHPEGTLAVTVVAGASALVWFAYYLWSVLGDFVVVW